MVRLVKFSQMIRTCTTHMGKIRKNPYLAPTFEKSRKTSIFATFWVIILDDFQDLKKSKIFELQMELLYKSGSFSLTKIDFPAKFFFKRKIMIRPTYSETVFTIFAFCCNLRSRVVTSQIVIMTRHVSNWYRFSKNSTSLTEIATEMIPTVLGS